MYIGYLYFVPKGFIFITHLLYLLTLLYNIIIKFKNNDYLQSNNFRFLLELISLKSLVIESRNLKHTLILLFKFAIFCI